MASNFDIDGVRFELLSYIPDEVMQAFKVISEERYAAGLVAGRAEAAKAAAPKGKPKAGAVDRSGD
ncbi:hypothetical protein [Nonomuraea zeae]|uniref:hypothetical protein n=1 Tax=Nonomuraea zeae TaxID=1642303 RepID=UPI003618FE2F